MTLYQITMYRLMFYYLIFLVVIATVESTVGILPHNPLGILFGAIYLAGVCWLSNKIFARILRIKTNPESVLITGLILSLIIGPVSSFSSLLLLTVVAVSAMASKYILAFRKRHFFNPAAFGAFVVAIFLGQGASWWIGNAPMSPFLILGGFLILKKIRRFTAAIVFILSTTILSFILNPLITFSPFSVYSFIIQYVLVSPIIFFSSVMLIEPQTSPTGSGYQILYAILVAAFFYITGNRLNFPYPLEASLLAGNIFSYVFSRSFRQPVVLKEKIQLTKDVITFIFEPGRKFQFKAGQFLEWTLSHPNPDSRGIRRFFTISSSPTESFIALTTKFYEDPSTYKQALQKMESGNEIVISGLGGDFTLPEDINEKLVLIAGGIGVTPIRSMVKYMLDNNEKRDVVVLYSNKTEQDILFNNLFEKAEKVGVSTFYINTQKDGYVDEKMIKKLVPDIKERIFYVSGPEPMVEAFEKILKAMEVAAIKRDYFPGYTETYQK